MVKVNVDTSKLRAMLASSEKSPQKLKQNIAGALYDGAKFCRTDMSRQIREHVHIKKKDVDEHIHIDRPDAKRLVAGVTLRKTDRIPLKDFGARQTKQGVTYKIAKSAEAAALMKRAGTNYTNPPAKTKGKRKGKAPSQNGRGRVPSGFGPNVPRLGGHVFKRVPGATRLPIIKLYGPSAWGVFVRLKLRKKTAKAVLAYVMDRLERRIKYQK